MDENSKITSTKEIEPQKVGLVNEDLKTKNEAEYSENEEAQLEIDENYEGDEDDEEYDEEDEGEEYEEEDQEIDQEEINLIFLGTFYHDNNKQENIDYVQFKSPVQVTEIRVIPLGTSVPLSNGSVQLGATNPSELNLEFYFIDLTRPKHSVFELIEDFRYNDKEKITLVCDPTLEVITDGILVRGLYSAVTLAMYGFQVENVPIKEVPEKELNENLKPKDEKDFRDNGEENSKSSIKGISLKDVKLEPEENEKLSPFSELKAKFGEKEINESLSSPSLSSPLRLPDDNLNDLKNETNENAIDIISPEDPFKSYDNDIPAEKVVKHEVIAKSSNMELDEDFRSVESSPKNEPKTNEDFGHEDISDGEICSDSEDVFIKAEVSNSPKLPMDQISTSSKISNETPTEKPGENEPKISTFVDNTDPISPQHEQLSDLEDLDDFHDQDFEELSDEEMQDMSEYDYGEWEVYWHTKVHRRFDPFLENYEINPLKNFQIKNCELVGYKNEIEKIALERFSNLASKFSEETLTISNQESWIENMENNLPILASTLNYLEANKENLAHHVKLVKFWVTKSLDLEFAMEQSNLPFKLRHIKAGIRLIQCLGNVGGVFSSILHEPFPCNKSSVEREETCIQHLLIDLFEQKHMNVSSRMLILRTLDATLNSRKGYTEFTTIQNAEGLTCYQRLIETSINHDKIPVRLTFGIRSLLKKLNIFESLENLEKLTETLIKIQIETFECPIEKVDKIVGILNNVKEACVNVKISLSYPVRFIPAKTIVEMPPTNSPGHNPKVSFVHMLKEMKFMKIIAVLLNLKDMLMNVFDPICEILQCLSQWKIGLVYLCDEGVATTIVIKTLLQSEEDGIGDTSAILLANNLEIMRAIDVITTCQKSEKNSEVEEEDLKALQIIFNFLSQRIGKLSILSTLTIGNLIVPILNCIKSSATEPGYFEMTDMEKATRQGYSIQIVSFIVKHCEKLKFLGQYGPVIYEKLICSLEDSEYLRNIQGLLPYLTPTLSPINFTFEGIDLLCIALKEKCTDLCDSSVLIMDNSQTLLEVISCLRILQGHCILFNEDDVTINLKTSHDECGIRELKYKFAIARMRSLDIVSIIIGVLNKIISEFSQPSIHLPLLIASKGELLTSFLLPLIKILRKVLTQLIEVQKTEFRDVTSVPVLLQIYGILNMIPVNAMCFGKSQEICLNIIGTLLAFTIPNLKQGEEAEDELNKSTWTAILSEIIKYTLVAPFNFIPGLTLISEILPLPLPVASKIPLTEAECSESVKLRRLWTAYLHCVSSDIIELIGLLSGSTQPRLLTVLKKVCVQLADLSSATCLVVCRSILESIFTSIENDCDVKQKSLESTALTSSSSTSAWVENTIGKRHIQCSKNTAKLLGFLASLINNAGTVKCGLLQIIRGMTKIDEKFIELISLLCSILSSPAEKNSYQIQAQDHILTIFQSMCDVENNILFPLFGRCEKSVQSETILSNSLPQPEVINPICVAMLSYLNSLSEKITSDPHVIDGVLRTLEIIAETEYGFYHLRRTLEQFPGTFENLCRIICKSDLENSEELEILWPTISSLVMLLKSLLSAKEESSCSLLPRQSSVKVSEAIKILGWDDTQSHKYNVAEDEVSHKRQKLSSTNSHPLRLLKNALDKYVKSNEDSPAVFLPLPLNYETIDIDNAVLILSSVLQFLDSSDVKEAPLVKYTISSPELLSEIYTLRPINVLVDNIHTLPSFWMTSIPPAFELDEENSKNELVSTDLTEISREFLNSLDIQKEIGILCSQLNSKNDFSENQDKKSNVHHEGMKKSMTREALLGTGSRRPPYNSSMRGSPNRGGFGRSLAGPGRSNVFDPFRSRPPNTSRPPSLHVDDFVALESSGSQSYNKAGIRNSSSGGSENMHMQRGMQRGSISRAYNSQERNRTGPTGNFRTAPSSGSMQFYPQHSQRHEGNQSRGRFPRGRGYNEGRWPESRGYGAQGSNSHTPMNFGNDEAFRNGNRSNGSNGPNMSTGRSYSRNTYREAPANPRVVPSNNLMSPQRWRDKPRSFPR